MRKREKLREIRKNTEKYRKLREMFGKNEKGVKRRKYVKYEKMRKNEKAREITRNARDPPSGKRKRAKYAKIYETTQEYQK